MPKDKKDKASPNPNFVECGKGEEKGMEQITLRIRRGSDTELRFIACAAPIQVNVRLDFDPVLEKRLPTDDGTNVARYLLPGNLAPGREHVVDWFYDSPVDLDKWATTTEVWTDGAVIFRHHKKASGNHPYRFGYVRLEVV